MILEGRGRPTAVIVTDAFNAPADAMAEVQGAPGYRYVTTPHPVAVLTPEEVRARAESVLPQVVALITETIPPTRTLPLRGGGSEENA